ncbi:efflux RND transporter permease subunit, partial [Klebsiella pneumoniae]|uniref:efflux RND transporter permease subunit n=1 Tax=Klebsiella pneumoniae TaxID=573 RepID=UPI00210E8FEF
RGERLGRRWSSYVNDFMDRGRVKKVYVQAAAKYRMLPDDINLWYVRNSSGTMVPFSAFATSRWETGTASCSGTSPRSEQQWDEVQAINSKGTFLT